MGDGDGNRGGASQDQKLSTQVPIPRSARVRFTDTSWVRKHRCEERERERRERKKGGAESKILKQSEANLHQQTVCPTRGGEQSSIRTCSGSCTPASGLNLMRTHLVPHHVPHLNQGKACVIVIVCYLQEKRFLQL